MSGRVRARYQNARAIRAMRMRIASMRALHPTYYRSTTCLLAGYSWKTIDPTKPGGSPRGYFQYS